MTVKTSQEVLGFRRSWRIAGSPSDGTSGTLYGRTDPGDLLIDTTAKKLYQNTNTKASPIWGQVLTGDIDFDGRIIFNGTFTDHILDFSSVTLGAEKQAIRAGAYGTPIALYPNGGLIYMYGSQSGDTGTSAITFFYGVTTGQGGMVADSALAESLAVSPGPRTLQGGQFQASLGSASYLRTLGGDATAGMYAVWAKVRSAGDSVASAGSRVAAIWLDNQLQGTVSGEEYAAFITTGGSVPKAVFGFETTGAGWAQFLYFDDTCNTVTPVVTSGLNVSGAGSTEAYLKVLLDSTQYGIPLIAV